VIDSHPVPGPFVVNERSSTVGDPVMEVKVACFVAAVAIELASRQLAAIKDNAIW
jgi:hypothetical protein